MTHDALFGPFDNLEVVGGHFLEGFERAQVHFAYSGSAPRGPGGIDGNLPEHGTSNIVGDVSTADDDDAIAEVGRIVQRDIAEKFDPAQDTGGVRAGHGEGPGTLRAHGDDDGVVALTELREGHVYADAAIRFRQYAEGQDHLDLGADKVAGQSVLGYAEGEHTCEDRLHFVDCHGKAEQGQIVRGGETRRAAPDDADTFARSFRHIMLGQGLQEGQEFFLVLAFAGRVFRGRLL